MDELVSRQTLLKLMGEEPFNWTDSDKELQEIEDYRNFRNMVEQLPPVTLQPNTGHWIDGGEYICFGGRQKAPCICSICRKSALNEPWYYCPNCGARMFEPQERSK